MDSEKFKQTAPLVVLCQHGNKQAMREIYIKYHRNIFFTAKLMGADMEYAMKLTADIFLKMFSSVEKLSDHMAFEQWFYSLAISMCKAQPKETAEDEDYNEKIVSFAKEASSAAKEKDKFGFEHAVSRLLENVLFSMENEKKAVFLYSFLANLETEKTALLERCTKDDIKEKLDGTCRFLGEKTQEIKKYGVDISPFVREPEVMLSHMAAKSFVPDGVHKKVSDEIGIDVNPFSASEDDEKKEEDNTVSADDGKKAVSSERKPFSKSDLILFVVMIVISALVFSGVKLYYKIKAESSTVSVTTTQSETESDFDSSAGI